MKKKSPYNLPWSIPTFCFVLLIGLFAGCGPKHGEIVEQFVPQYNEMRAELASIASLIPDKVTPTDPPPALDPMPEFKKGVLRSNTSIVMFENLSDPDLDLYKDGKLDCRYSNNLMRNLHWTSPKDFMSDNLKKKVADKELENRLQYPLDVRYIGVVRVFKHEPAKATSAEIFSPGGMIIGVFLYDRQAETIVAQGLTMARTDENVEYRYAETGDPIEALERWANSSLKMNAGEEVLKAFAKFTGGPFQ